MRGRKPLSNEMRALRGDTGVTVSAPDSPCPEPPAWLSPGAASEWSALAPGLHRTGCLTSSDINAFASYCVAVAQYASTVLSIAASEAMIPGSTGQLRLNPLYDLADKLQKQIRAWSVEFGLTPSARCRITLPPANDEADEFDSFVDQK